MEQLLDKDIVSLPEAAATLGIPEKRLLGFLMRNSLPDPIGGDTPEGIMVYGWSLKGLAKRIADESSTP